MHLTGHVPEQFREIDGVRHQATGIDIISVWAHRGEPVLLGEFSNQFTMSVKVTFAADQYSVWSLLCHRSEDALNLGWSALGRQHETQRNSEPSGGVPQHLSGRTFPPFAHTQENGFSRRRDVS